MITLGSIALRRYRISGPETGQSTPPPARAPRRLSQGVLAARLGCSHAMISQIEAGTKQPSVALAAKIEALGICMAADFAKPATCTLCERRLDDMTIRGCSASDCPHLDRMAA